MSTNSPRPWDSTTDLLKKLLRIFGGLTSPVDSINNLLAKIIDRAEANLGVESLTYAASVELDFATFQDKTINLSGDLTLTTANLTAGSGVSIRIVCDGSNRNFNFPVGWTFIGGTVPASIDAGKTAILSLRSYGTTDADVVAGYSVES